MAKLKYIAKSKEDLRYPNSPLYPNILWVKDGEYEATDDGSTLSIATEEDGAFHLIGHAREWFWERFEFVLAPKEGADTE